MTVGIIIGLILLPFAWALMAAANKQHRDETGVNAPTRDGWRRIRRNARKKGISEAEAYNEWLNRKTRKTASASSFEYFPDRRLKGAPPPLPPPLPATNEATQDAADEPLRALASSQKWDLQRQADGRYYILNLQRSPTAFVRNPLNREGYDFTREQVIRFLSGTLDTDG